MSTTETQQGFPKISAPLCNNDLTINQIWLQLLITLWNRTGGGPGASTNEALFWGAANDALARRRDDSGGGGSGGGGGEADLGAILMAPGASLLALELSGANLVQADSIITQAAAAADLGAPQGLAGDPLAALLFESAFAGGSGAANTTMPLYAPMVTGVLPGPDLMANADGTCIMTVVDCVSNTC